MTIALIPSAAYIDMELAAEFGRIPPAFLPVGHKRLYELQHEALKSDERTYLTLPQSYVVPEADLAYFSLHRIQLVAIPEGLTLGRSIQYALDVIGNHVEPIRMLHGDTLIADVPLDPMDVVAVGCPPEGYEWGLFTPEGTSTAHVLAGYFAFSDAVEFRRSLTLADGNFTHALGLYSKCVELKEVVVGKWLDFGHLQPFYRARCNVQTQRAFNALQLNFQRVRKTGLKHRKIQAEAAWFRSLPEALRLYIPAYLGAGASEDGQPWYELEYLPMPSLHELFVFGELSGNSWKRIFQGCVRFIESCKEQTTLLPNIGAVSPFDFRAAIKNKTEERLYPWLS